MSDDHNCFHIVSLSSLHHFWKTYSRWRKSTSLSDFLKCNLLPSKATCRWFLAAHEAKRSMCIMPLLGANTFESKGNTWAPGRTCRRPESDHAKLLSSKANVSWHAAIFKMLPSVSKQSFKTIARIAAINAVAGPVSRVDTVSLHTRFVFGKFAEFFWSVLAAGCLGAQARLR